MRNNDANVKPEIVEAYAAAWARLESQEPQPQRFKWFVAYEWAKVSACLLNGDVSLQADLARLMYRGFAIVLRGAFPVEFMRSIRQATVEWTKQRPSEFHKMVQGCPDFHRVITPEIGDNYSFYCCKHSAYFYGWNDDPLMIRKTIYERWRPMKLLMGMAPDTYEHNTPRDGVVDRIQIVRYPPGEGMLVTHSDPFKHQRIFLSGIMSKRGVDYEGGGFYMVRENGEKESLEPYLNVGDIVIGYATVHHGVDPCDGVCDWSKSDGRWFLSMYSNASDEVANRHTGYAVK